MLISSHFSNANNVKSGHIWHVSSLTFPMGKNPVAALAGEGLLYV